MEQIDWLMLDIALVGGRAERRYTRRYICASADDVGEVTSPPCNR